MSGDEIAAWQAIIKTRLEKAVELCKTTDAEMERATLYVALMLSEIAVQVHDLTAEIENHG